MTSTKYTVDARPVRESGDLYWEGLIKVNGQVVFIGPRELYNTGAFIACRMAESAYLSSLKGGK
jgi:hypothetical protein